MDWKEATKGVLKITLDNLSEYKRLTALCEGRNDSVYCKRGSLRVILCLEQIEISHVIQPSFLLTDLATHTL